MQEFQSIPGLAGRLFGGVAAGATDLRRAQAHAHAQQGPGAARCGGVSPAAGPPEAVKCPRCESTNTKFCYYNNYNLSQPRHFCKSCRRYWTKGGVLRNVPVGGGCRKTKRAASSSTSPASSAATSAPSTPTSGDAAPAAANKNPRRASASSPRSNSNSGSASPTAAATTPAPTPNPSPTTPATPSSNSSVAAAFTTSSRHHHHHSNPFSTIDVVAPPAPIFADQAAALASLFAPPPPPPLPVFTFAAQPKVEAPTTPSELELQLVAGHDAAAAAAAAPCSSSMGVSEDMAPFASLDAAGIFELGDAASAAAYWNAGSCWTDVQDPSMYLP